MGDIDQSRPSGGMHRGRLKLFLGAAPGSGKTFAMLEEAHRLKEAGVAVVVGYVQTYDRPLTAALLEGLELVPRLRSEYRGLVLKEMDTQALVNRRPAVAVVDELAHSNAPGSQRAKRWQDVEYLRDHGIDVLTTMNIQHAESIKDIVEGVTGTPVRETVPDTILDSADELVLADITPEALRKRMRHGNIYPLDRVDRALANYFREGNLAALRELAVSYVLSHPSRQPRWSRGKGGRVMITIACRPSSLGLIRRGARMARRLGLSATVLTVREAGGEAADIASSLSPYSDLARTLGLDFVIRYSDNMASAVVSAAKEFDASHVVLGAPNTNQGLSLRASPLERIVLSLSDRNVHVIGRRLGTHRVVDDESLRDPERMLLIARDRAHRGDLRLYLGYAPGVGKTTRLLEEALRRRGRGTDVLVACADPKGRPAVAYLLEQLPVLPPTSNGLLDIEAILELNPGVVCVDDIAHRDSQSECARYQQLDQLTAAGITVVASVGVLDLESARPWWEHAGATTSMDSMPDSFLDGADEIELVDVAPRDLQERLQCGLIRPPSDLAEGQRLYQIDTLEVLRDTALRRLATHTDRRLLAYIEAHGIDDLWPTRDRLVVFVSPRRVKEAAALLDAGLQLGRQRDAEVVLVSVTDSQASPEQHRRLAHLEALARAAGVFLVPLVYKGSWASALIHWARRHQVTEIILPSVGSRRPWPWQQVDAMKVVWEAKDIDVHLLGMPSRFQHLSANLRDQLVGGRSYAS